MLCSTVWFGKIEIRVTSQGVLMFTVKNAIMDVLSKSKSVENALECLEGDERVVFLETFSLIKTKLDGKYDSYETQTNGQWTLEKAAKPKISRGFFKLDHLHEVLKQKDHSGAKEYAHSVVDSNEGATPANKSKAKRMIDGSKHTNHLAIGMSNFMLSHPSEGLGVNKLNKANTLDYSKLNQPKEQPASTIDYSGGEPKTTVHKPEAQTEDTGIKKPWSGAIERKKRIYQEHERARQEGTLKSCDDAKKSEEDETKIKEIKDKFKVEQEESNPDPAKINTRIAVKDLKTKKLKN